MGQLIRIGLKAVALFLIFNLIWLAAQPMTFLNRLTVYNGLVPGRERFPFAEYPAESYALTVNSLDQIFAAHIVSRPKAADEFRVLHIGDSGVWGYLLEPDQSQAACITRQNLTLPDGRRVVAYNLGYPTLTAVKDLLILRRGLQHQPDLVIWSITLASLYPADQLDFPLLHAARDEIAALQAEYAFNLPQWPLPAPEAFARTFIGQRRQVADWLRHQLYGPAWAATRIDHRIPKFVAPHPVNLDPNDGLLSVNVVNLREPGRFTAPDLALDVVRVGMEWAKSAGVPLVLVNAPMYRNDSHPLRYNTYYPRWAYDSYREVMAAEAAREGWRYRDLWDAAPPDAFTDTDFHLTATANCTYAERLIRESLAATVRKD